MRPHYTALLLAVTFVVLAYARADFDYPDAEDYADDEPVYLDLPEYDDPPAESLAEPFVEPSPLAADDSQSDAQASAIAAVLTGPLPDADLQALSSAGHNILNQPIGKLLGNLHEGLGVSGDAGALAALTLGGIGDQFGVFNGFGRWLRIGTDVIAKTGLLSDSSARIESLGRAGRVLEALDSDKTLEQLLKIGDYSDTSDIDLVAGFAQKAIAELAQSAQSTAGQLGQEGAAASAAATDGRSALEEAQALLSGDE